MLVLVLFVVLAVSSSQGVLCPKQCDCDMVDGLNRATCVDQNIVNIDVGVPKEVQDYSLARNVISELENFCFMTVGYTNLKRLDLSNNLIFWIGLHAFSGLNKLENLDLSNNRLRGIPSDLFWDVPQLQQLDLSSNVFEKLNNEPLIAHTKLQVLNLNNCRIKALPERLFNRLPNLRKLDLSENYMVTFNLDVIKPLKKLDRIELRNDYWQCNPDFIAVETWIISHNIKYEKKCIKKLPKMSEKMISLVPNRSDVDIGKIWNVTLEKNNTHKDDVNKTPVLTVLEKFDRDFSAVQAFVMGIEIGVAIGIIMTYFWVLGYCSCGSCCKRDGTRQISRRRDGDMRTNLLWSQTSDADLETPRLYRRELSLPEIAPPFAAYGTAGLHVDAIRVQDREETPPPPYNDCRFNI